MQLIKFYRISIDLNDDITNNKSNSKKQGKKKWKKKRGKDETNKNDVKKEREVIMIVKGWF